MQQVFDAGMDHSKSWSFARDFALVQLMAGDIENYRTAANEMSDRIGGNLDAHSSKWLAHTFVSAPGMITDENRPRLLDAATRVGANWNPRLTASVHFRAGDYEQAAELFDQYPVGRPSFLFLAAMTHHRLGITDRALQLLAEGNARMQQKRDNDPDSGVPQDVDWHDWALYLTLQREAEALLGAPPEP
jgi:hypothetical protein